MLQEALRKLQKEVSDNPKDKYVQVIGRFLIIHLREHPGHAEKILSDDKSVTGSLEAMKEEARKNQSNGVGVLNDEEGFAIVLSYFGIETAKPEQPVVAGFNVDVDSLL